MPLHNKYRHKQTGFHGEQLAAEYLVNKGYEVIDRNVYLRWGELDIVAVKDNVIHFVEVKTRYQTRQGLPYEAVRVTKLSHLMRTIQYYIKRHKFEQYKFQLDVISIILFPDSSVNELKMYENVAVDRFM